MREFFLDTETTGLSQETDRVVEVCLWEMVRRELVNPDEVPDAKLHLYIKPLLIGSNEQMPMPEEAYRVHKISDAFLADKPCFAEVAESIMRLLKGARVYAHNAEFDIGFLDAEFRRLGMPSCAELGVEVVDTLKLARDLLNNTGGRFTLDALWKRFEIQTNPRIDPWTGKPVHGAEVDVFMLFYVWRMLTGGQNALDIGVAGGVSLRQEDFAQAGIFAETLPVIWASAEECAEDAAYREAIKSPYTY